ncbi:MAG: hypothetical protein QOG98_889, partial [Pseudonocardiales bacterium]|nr:hypothetical protein [Pseudonocardiales bacterium]
MFGSTGGQDWDLLLQRLTGVLDDLQAASVSSLSGEQELHVLRTLQSQQNRIPT